MALKKYANKYREAKINPNTNRVDCPIEPLVYHLRKHHERSEWTVQERENSIGVYVTASKHVCDVAHGFAAGYLFAMNQEKKR